jgi:hypothetical protein
MARDRLKASSCRGKDQFLKLGMLAASLAISLLLGGLTASTAAACPNEEVRLGVAASLPDCRGYELVTPPDSDGRLFFGLKSALPYSLFPTELVSPVRDSVLYMTLGGPLAEPQDANGTYDLYEAARSSSGWSTVRRLSPSGSQAVFPNTGGVSGDHLYAFTEVGPVQGTRDGGSLAEGGNAEYLSRPDGSFELVGRGLLAEEPLAQGRFISAGGQHIIFSTGGAWCSLEGSSCVVRRLEAQAPETGTPAIYDRSANGSTNVVSLLPGDATPAPGEAAEYQGTSADGSTVAFKIGGTLYVRLNNERTEEVAPGPDIVFAGVAGDGSRVFYLRNGDLYAFETGTETTRSATGTEDLEVVNISGDGSHVYFLSPSQLVDSSGTASEPNLYVWDLVDNTLEFIATVSPADLEGEPALNNWTDSAVLPNKIDDGQGPGADSSRTTFDGKVFVFESKAKLTDYETAGFSQIYRYDSVRKTLQCVSCNPLASESEAGSRLENVRQLGAAAVIHNLSADGSSAFFETSEALDPRDVDGVNDIYRWQAPTSTAPATVALISSGVSPSVSTFDGKLETNLIFGITPSASDVVFLAYERLLPKAGAGGLPALYDARVDGGFPEGDAYEAECSGERCRPPVVGGGPTLVSPGSLSLVGGRNAKPMNRRCHRNRKRKARKTHRCHRRKRQQVAPQGARPHVDQKRDR